MKNIVKKYNDNTFKVITISDCVGRGRCIFGSKDSISDTIGKGVCCRIVEQIYKFTSHHISITTINNEFKESSFFSEKSELEKLTVGSPFHFPETFKVTNGKDKSTLK